MRQSRRARDEAERPPGEEGAVYRIRVRGRLAAHWTDRLSGMTLTVREAAGTAPATELTGRLADQAELMGVLEQLHALGTQLLAVRRLEAATDAAVDDPGPKEP